MMEALFSEWDNVSTDRAIKPLVEVKPQPTYDNPCMNLYGKGPQGKLCKDCDHLIRDYYHNKTYFKCELRKLTRGAGSDHRANWYACAKFEPEKEEVQS